MSSNGQPIQRHLVILPFRCLVMFVKSICPLIRYHSIVKLSDRQIAKPSLSLSLLPSSTPLTLSSIDLLIHHPKRIDRTNPPISPFKPSHPTAQRNLTILRKDTESCPSYIKHMFSKMAISLSSLLWSSTACPISRLPFSKMVSGSPNTSVHPSSKARKSFRISMATASKRRSPTVATINISIPAQRGEGCRVQKGDSWLWCEYLLSLRQHDGVLGRD